MNKSNRKLLVTFSILISILVLGSIIYNVLTDDKMNYNRIIRLERHTKVIKVYLDKPNRGFIIVYKNGERQGRFYNLKVGDSISKNKGDSIMYIYGKDSIIPINLLLYGDKVN